MAAWAVGRVTPIISSTRAAVTTGIAKSCSARRTTEFWSGLVEQFVAKLVLQFDEADGPFLGVACLSADAAKEEGDPRYEVALLARDQQVVVVLAAMLFEVGGEVEQRLAERAAQHQHQRDHQTSDPTVAVEERMDRLELVVGDGELHEQREVGLVEELLQIAQRALHLAGGWRHEDGIVQGAASDPHRALAQLPRQAVLAPHAVEQTFLHPPEQPDRDGEPVADAGEAVLHREDVVVDLGRVIDGITRGKLPGLEEQKLAHVGLRALDPGAEHRFEAEVRPDEQVWVGDDATDAAEAMDRACRLVEELHRLIGQREPARRLSWKERPSTPPASCGPVLVRST